jgi:hypothetical protein
MIFGQAWMGGVVAVALALPHGAQSAGAQSAGAQSAGAQSAKITRTSDPQVCLDDMETVPDPDDLTPILVSADDGCVLVQAPISI